MPTILLIDDERFPMDYYVRVLRSRNFEVKLFKESDSAITFIEQKRPQISVVVLDVMMPPGKRYVQEDTEYGLRTGYFLYKDIRAMYPDIPIIFLTNISETEIPDFPNETPNTLKIVHKMDCTPFEFADLVENMTSRSENLVEA